MFAYNPKRKQTLEEGSVNGWTACIKKTGENRSEKNILVVTNKTLEQKYVVDGFKNNTNYEFDEEDLWYSFDPDSGNFHIVPDKSARIEVDKDIKRFIDIAAFLQERLECIRKKIEEKSIPNITVYGKVSKGNPPNINHRYICVNSGGNQYLLSFNRLWCEDRDGDSDNGSDNQTFHIHNNFGQAQFMCYPIKVAREAVGEINCIDGKFRLMYPNSDEDRQYKSEAGHIAYNAPYTIKNTPEEIAESFVRFIELCEVKRILCSAAQFIFWMGTNHDWI